MLATMQMARGSVALSAGRHAVAFEELARLFDPADTAYHPSMCVRAVGDLAEAAVHCGREAEAQAVVDRLIPLLDATPSPWLHIGMRQAAAVLAPEAEAEERFRAALAEDLAAWPIDRARALLAYGTWLRRHRRPAESRAPLRAARDTFDAVGAVAWGERARAELRAAGEVSRRRAVDARESLTPQELQIAQLAAEGRTNREIGEMLYLSHRTVGSHLYRAFPKLGITGRAELRDALRDRVVDPPGVP